MARGWKRFPWREIWGGAEARKRHASNVLPGLYDSETHNWYVAWFLGYVLNTTRRGAGRSRANRAQGSPKIAWASILGRVAQISLERQSPVPPCQKVRVINTPQPRQVQPPKITACALFFSSTTRWIYAWSLPYYEGYSTHKRSDLITSITTRKDAPIQKRTSHTRTTTSSTTHLCR